MEALRGNAASGPKASFSRDFADGRRGAALTGLCPVCRVIARGAVAQLGECLTGSQEVASSILASSTIDSTWLMALQPPRQSAWWHSLVARRPIS